jgi:hypothetical protein
VAAVAPREGDRHLAFPVAFVSSYFLKRRQREVRIGCKARVEPPDRPGHGQGIIRFGGYYVKISGAERRELRASGWGKVEGRPQERR